MTIPFNDLAAFSEGAQRLVCGQALDLGRDGGELALIQGVVWLTCSKDLCDYFIEPGQRIRLLPGGQAVIEAARGNQEVVFCWRPRRQGVAVKLLVAYLRSAAVWASLAARTFAAFARHARESANRIQGFGESAIVTRPRSHRQT